MPAAFKLKVVTPHEVFFEGDVVSVVAPGGLGYLGILKDHAPLVTTISKGNLTFRSPEGQTKAFKIQNGFLEVLKNKVLVLTEQISQ